MARASHWASPVELIPRSRCPALSVLPSAGAHALRVQATVPGADGHDGGATPAVLSDLQSVLSGLHVGDKCRSQVTCQ